MEWFDPIGPQKKADCITAHLPEAGRTCSADKRAGAVKTGTIGAWINSFSKQNCIKQPVSGHCLDHQFKLKTNDEKTSQKQT